MPIQVTGDPAKRFNLVVLGDGYTAAELPKFREHVDKHLNVLWTIEPFKSYRSYVNVYAVEIESAESGVDCDPALDSPRRDTPLDMGFWGGCNPDSVQRLLTVDGSAANPTPTWCPARRAPTGSCWRSATATPTAARAARTPPRPAATRCPR